MIAPELHDSLRGRNVLITGGLGFLGSTLARELAAAKANVVLVDSLVPEYGGNRENIAGFEDAVTVNVSDVRDQHSLRELVRGRDILFNLAGQTSHLDSMTDPYTDLEINCRAQLSILEACRHENPEIRIVFASTRQIYGRPQHLPVSESHPIAPVDVNGINKTAGEWYHLLYGEVYGLHVAVLRMTNTYGPRMRVKDARQTFLGYWLRHALSRDGRSRSSATGRRGATSIYVGRCVHVRFCSRRCSTRLAAASTTSAATRSWTCSASPNCSSS